MKAVRGENAAPAAWFRHGPRGPVLCSQQLKGKANFPVVAGQCASRREPISYSIGSYFVSSRSGCVTRPKGWRHGTASELEGASQAVVGLLRGGALSGDLDQPAHTFQRHQSAKPATASATTSSTPRPAAGRSRKTASRVISSRKAGMCWSRRKNSTRWRWKARIPSTSSEFVPMAEVDRIYLDESYYLVPQDDISQEAFAVIREAMRKEDLVGLARVVIYRREHVLLLAPRGKGIMATALRYKNEVRNEKVISTRSQTSRCPPTCSNWRCISWRQEGPLRSGQVRGPLRASAE